MKAFLLRAEGDSGLRGAGGAGALCCSGGNETEDDEGGGELHCCGGGGGLLWWVVVIIDLKGQRYTARSKNKESSITKVGVANDF